MTPNPLEQPDVIALVHHLRSTAIVLVAAFVVWRLLVALLDRFFARRFLGRFIPRVATFASLSKSMTGIVMLAATVLVLLDVWSVDVTPAVWSAGIVTAALAFGAQALVKDLIAGASFLFEDQFDVGDAVELQVTATLAVTGTVQAVGLRTTRLVDGRGRDVIVPNGSILMVSNASRRPSRAGYTITMPWRGDAVAMREQLEKHARDAAAEVGIGHDAVEIVLEHADAAEVRFRIDVVARGADSIVSQHRIAERIAVRLQKDGWLQDGRAVAAGKTAAAVTATDAGGPGEAG